MCQNFVPDLLVPTMKPTRLVRGRMCNNIRQFRSNIHEIIVSSRSDVRERLEKRRTLPACPEQPWSKSRNPTQNHLLDLEKKNTRIPNVLKPTFFIFYRRFGALGPCPGPSLGLDIEFPVPDGFLGCVFAELDYFLSFLPGLGSCEHLFDDFSHTRLPHWAVN